jgi:GTPase SAR1 family protein
MGAIGRACSVVNLDPANDHTNYPCALDIRDLVKLEDVMRDDHLGPNGGILYALEELENNYEWLEAGLKEFGEDYVLFDCPGQVELYTHHNSLRNIFYKLSKIGFRVSLTCQKYYGPAFANSPCVVCLRTSLRFLLPNPAIPIRIQRSPLAPSHDSDGHATCQRAF